jgi:hypothetical protein
VTHFHIGFFEFLVFAMYYTIMKALILLINIESRRGRLHVPSAVSGLLS